MKNYQRHFIVGLFVVLFGVGACSSSSSTSTESEVTSESLQTIANIPDINLDNLDVALTANASVALPKNLLSKVVNNPSTEFSRAGCELRACVEEFKSSVLAFRVEKCAMEAMETHTDAEVGNGSYNFYEVTIPASADPEIDEAVETVAVKVGYNADDDEKLRIFLCELNSSGDLTHTLTATFEVADGKFVGTITDILESDENTSELDAFRLSASLATESLADWVDGDTGQLSGQFGGYYGSGSITLDVAKADGTITNTVDAAFRSGDAEADWGDWTSLVYGVYNAEEGCSKWDSAGGYPAEDIEVAFDEETQAELALAGWESAESFCWKDADDPESEVLADWIEPADENGKCSFDEGSTECFSFSFIDSVLNYFTYDTSLATYFATVSGENLQSFSAPTVEFTSDEVWDCQAPNGFTEIDLTSNDAAIDALAACFSLEEQEDEERNIDSCYDLEKEDDAEDAVGEEFE